MEISGALADEAVFRFCRWQMGILRVIHFAFNAGSPLHHRIWVLNKLSHVTKEIVLFRIHNTKPVAAMIGN